MRIVEFAIHQVRIPLKKEIRHASHARTSTDSLVIACRLDSGTVGWGEGLPRQYVTGETIDDAWGLLPAIPWSSQFGGSIQSHDDAVGRLTNCPPAPQAGDDRQCFGNSLRCAIELSVLDAVCRELGLPLSTVTAHVLAAQPVHEARTQVNYSGAFTSMKPWKQRALGWLLWAYGLRQAKVKVGVEGVDDAAMLRRIRSAVGREVDLRIDANEAWTSATVARHVELLLPFGISSLEQPVPHADVAGLAPLRRSIGVPLMLDESLCSAVDAQRAIEQGTCDLFNLRISKCGGFISTLKLAAQAHAAGLGYQLGCQVGETGILSAAGRHFATSVGGIRFLEGSYDRFLVRERLTVEDLTWGYAGRAPALTKPGLGVTVDLSALARVSVREQRFAVL